MERGGEIGPYLGGANLSGGKEYASGGQAISQETLRNLESTMFLVTIL